MADVTIQIEIKDVVSVNDLGEHTIIVSILHGALVEQVFENRIIKAWNYIEEEDKEN